jgi:hypothetical protein
MFKPTFQSLVVPCVVTKRYGPRTRALLASGVPTVQKQQTDEMKVACIEKLGVRGCSGLISLQPLRI